MKKRLYKKIDAFTDGKSSGNPAGFILLDENEYLSEEAMLAIARGQKGNVSEVAFCTPVDSDLYSFRYFSSECEVEFCGHATIASMVDLIKNNPDLQEKDQIMIKTVRGELPVFNDIRNSDSVFIAAPEPKYLPAKPDPIHIADYLSIPVGQINTQLNISVINAGLRTLIVPIGTLNDIANIQPDQTGLATFCLGNEIDIILVFCSEVALKTTRFHTRVFAPKYGYLEDPATGSGNAAFGYYLLRESLWDGGLIIIEQGPDTEEPNIIQLKTVVLDKTQRVLFGGNATVRYEKELGR